jgi:hypothetical protein
VLQKIDLNHEEFGDIDYFYEGLERMRIDVFTSEYCSFCEDALEVARFAAGRATYLANPIDVVETSVDEQPELIEALNLIALPLIQIGSAQIIGLPKPEDIDRLIHQTLLMG